MTVAVLLDECRSRGIELTPVGDRLRYRAPAGALSDDLRAALATHRSELCAWVRNRMAVDVVLAAFPGATVIVENAPASPRLRQGAHRVEVWAVGDPCLSCGGTEYLLPPRNGHCGCVTCHPDKEIIRRKDDVSDKSVAAPTLPLFADGQLVKSSSAHIARGGHLQDRLRCPARPW